ncbi:MAG: lysine biosynthesis protein LysW [Promethearchaeota archaeon]
MGKKVECPSCYYEWELDDPDLVPGEVITCPDCGIDLEITSISDDSISLEKLDVAEEDWGE